jgi:hypothetical protein
VRVREAVIRRAREEAERLQKRAAWEASHTFEEEVPLYY